MKRWQNKIIIIISILGVIISADLTYLHIKTISNPEYRSFCNISERINCDKVNSSRYSEIFSIPISHLGSLTYILVILLALFTLRGHPLSNLLSTLNFLIFVFCNLYSILLFYISLFIIESLCILCCGLYIVNLLLLIVSLFNLRGYFNLAFWSSLRAGKALSAAIVLFAIGGLVSILLVRDITIAGRQRSQVSKKDTTGYVIKDIDISGSFFKGPEDAPVTIVEVSDFECPFCRKTYPLIKEAAERYKDKVKLVFKNFPLGTDCNRKIKVNMHPSACLAAYASVCAGEQNRFWEYIDYLMKGSLDRESILKYAGLVGLDIGRFTTCLDSNTTKQTVMRDIETCLKCQIESVPTIFINGRMLIGTKSLQEYIMIIEEELNRQKR